MKNNSFYARPDTCREALRANKLALYPMKMGLDMVEWLEQRKECGEKIRNVMRQTVETEVPKSTVTKKRVNLCNLNDYP